ncbi:M24 family metallopeptidase [Peptoniphilus stercorisuis]|uniref:Xaa-Pro dipeptidase n=1 Tax=Peptoniphilus stercorisuis TaxID=1436965 RepID=A0ABS4KDG3_9FIRM|nr:Xaa-Pro peptidase family protein [Peptoniphilus stercorisuis]MBP2025807.1 Xaa-Pro dipeptidase [Peptoniphilus stercorisuis]
MNEKRLEKVLEKMKEDNLDQLLLCDPSSIFYLTNKWIYPGERMHILSIVSNGDVKFFVNKLFPIEEDLGVEIVWLDDTDEQIKILSDYVIPRFVGVDKDLSAKFLIPIMNVVDDADFIVGSYIIDNLRAIKDEDEIVNMKKSSSLNDKAMEKMKDKLSLDLSEKEMGRFLADTYEELGASGFSFDPIIAYGKNASNPHHENDDSKKEIGDSIVVDMGCRYLDYCSDMTRTFFYKEVSDEDKKVYDTVLLANLKAIEKIKPGELLSNIDKAARDVIEEAGYGEYFTHRTGHFIGLETHDKGDVSSANHNICEVGNIFSIEPGIYIPGGVGVRIEDLVLVTEDGCEILNSYPKELQIINN